MQCKELSINSTGWGQRSFHNWYRWFDEAPPKFIHYKCCAQFAVTRELIRRHSLNTWKKIHAKALAYRDDVQGKLPFEYLWRPLFDESDANTPCKKLDLQKVHKIRVYREKKNIKIDGKNASSNVFKK